MLSITFRITDPRSSSLAFWRSYYSVFCWHLWAACLTIIVWCWYYNSAWVYSLFSGEIRDLVVYKNILHVLLYMFLLYSTYLFTPPIYLLDIRGEFVIQQLHFFFFFRKAFVNSIEKYIWSWWTIQYRPTRGVCNSKTPFFFLWSL